MKKNKITFNKIARGYIKGKKQDDRKKQQKQHQKV